MSEPVRFDERGLVPCVLQDWSSGEVLTLAYMNEEALSLTRQTGEVHFFSRSRDELWRKGESSGNVQRLRQLRYDCDGDAVVALVDPQARPAIQASEAAFTANSRPPSDPTRPPTRRWPSWRGPCRRVASSGLRAHTRSSCLPTPSGSAAKLREEADEVARAAARESDQRLAEETADLLYHLEVLLLSRELPLSAALETLNDRRR